MSGLAESISNFFTPGLAQSRTAQIKVVAKKDGTFVVPLQSLHDSEQVKNQIAYLKAEKEGA
ncbi:hypothetical protein JL49_08085 [Pseudoalteromonas luteoviolacea]|uniref:hypothetical protein n=1 Tax=Pseudoalteromonas sp. MMG012 TaxID=2822686 RepID=UPI0007BC82E7|nr:hypothetical protein [Pseudoalteromonas sp. MMG012]KZX01005.1 hypothetical protein JL49_08085 [Pseudoalteromonas luteoviolacea]MBQ4852702.1 hypothetical protein [Pseudoalteromonas sp. MMG012]